MAYLGSISTHGAPFSNNKIQAFSGNGTATNFTLNYRINGKADVEVVVNNVQQNPFDGSYDVNNNNVLVFSSPPSAGSNNIHVYFRGHAHNVSIPDSNTINSSQLTTTGVVAGSYGNSTAIPVVTVDAAGRVTTATTSSVSGVTGLTYTSTNNTLTVSTSITNYTANISAGLDAAYSNAIAYSGNAALAYSNAVSVAATDATTKAVTAYANAVSYAASNTYVNTTFAPKAGPTFTGTAAFADVTVSGNLTTSGTTTYVNTTNLNIGDNLITLNADLGASAPSENAGIEVNRGTSANVALLWNETGDYWALGNTTITGFASISGDVTLSGGTANGLLYLNGSKVATSGSALTFDGTALSINGSASTVAYKLKYNGSEVGFLQNYTNTEVNFGSTVNAPILFYVNNSEQMRLTSTGLGIGTSSPSVKLDIVSTGHDVLKLSGGASATLIQFNASSTDDYAFGTITSLAGLGIKNLTDDRYDFFISDSGKVGIGTSSPGARLEVKNNSSDNYSTSIRLSQSYSAAYSYIASNFGGSMTLDAGVGASVPDIRFELNSSEKMRLTSTGLGIGTSSPARKLDVNGGARFVQDAPATTGAIVLRQNSDDTVGGFIQWVNNANVVEKGWLSVDTNSNMLFTTVSSERMRIDSSGNVGIGTSSPQSVKLDVAGGMKLRTQHGITSFSYYNIFSTRTTSGSNVYAHIKTNIQMVNIMFRLDAVGYNYGSATLINCSSTGYAYAGSNDIVSRGDMNWGGSATCNTYKSSDGYVVFRVRVGDGAYYAGFHVNAFFDNPTGDAFELAILSSIWTDSATNQY